MEKRCVIYTRVSSDRQVDGYSLDTQADLCRNEANRQEYTVVQLFREEGVSAKTLDRPQLSELLQFVTKKANNISAIIIYHTSRLSRNTLDFLQLKLLLSKKGISIISVTEPIAGDSPEQVFLTTVLSATNQLDNQIKARNVSNNMKKRFMEGQVIAKPRLGYLLEKKEGKTKTINDPYWFPILQNMWYRILTERLTLSQITKELNKYGKKKFIITSTQKIFTSKFYAGFNISEKYHLEVKGSHEPMITEEEYYQVQAIFRGRLTRKLKVRNLLRDDFILRGLLKCPFCDRYVTSAYSKGKHKSYPYYLCSYRSEGHKVINYKRDDLESKFIEYLKTIKPTEKFMDYFNAILKEKYEVRIKQLHTSEKLIKDEIKRLEIVKKRIRTKHRDGIYTDEEYLEMKEEIQIELATKKSLLSEKAIDKLDINALCTFLKYYLTNLDTIYMKLNPEGWYKMGCSLFPKGIYYENGYYRTPELGRGYKLIKDLEANPSLMVGQTFSPRTIIQ